MLVLGWVTAWEYMVLYTFWHQDEHSFAPSAQRLQHRFSGSGHEFLKTWTASPFTRHTSSRELFELANLFKGNALAQRMTWLMDMPASCLNDQALTLEITL